MDKEKKGDYIRYTNFSVDSNGRLTAFPTEIRKTLSDCTIEMPSYKYYEWGEVKIYYPNGSVYEGTLKVQRKAMRNVTHWEQFDNAVLMTSIIMGADSLADLGTFINGKLIDRQNNVKVYSNGQYDEVESIAYSQRLQAEKAKDQAAIKQKQKLIQRYGQKNVNLVLKPGVEVSDVLVPGMPIGLLIDLSAAGKISLEFKKSKVSSNSIRYDVYNYNIISHKNQLLGYVWTKNNKITSVVFY